MKLFKLLPLALCVVLFTACEKEQKSEEDTVGPDTHVIEFGDEVTWDIAQQIVRPQFLLHKEENQEVLLLEPFVNGVDLGYVLPTNEQKSYEFIGRQTFTSWDISKEELHKQAIKNLEDIDVELPFFQAQERQDQKYRYMVLETGDAYDAVRILLPEIREELADELGEPYIVGIPNRDGLLAWPEGFPAHNDFARLVKTTYAEDEEYPLLEELLRFDGDEIRMSVSE